VQCCAVLCGAVQCVLLCGAVRVPSRRRVLLPGLGWPWPCSWCSRSYTYLPSYPKDEDADDDDANNTLGSTASPPVPMFPDWADT
jgi:hypothetical protein